MLKDAPRTLSKVDLTGRVEHDKENVQNDIDMNVQTVPLGLKLGRPDQSKHVFSDTDKQVLAQQESNPFMKNILENLDKGRQREGLIPEDAAMVKQILEVEKMQE